jgi:sulfur relay (sulfurtransferase) complex TusBCD TusD component (DsrE family)
MASKTLGILLATSPEHEDASTAVRLAEAALAQGIEVKIFVMCDGVYQLTNPLFLALQSQGAELCMCAHNAVERDVAKQPEVISGSQYDLAHYVYEADRFVSLT